MGLNIVEEGIKIAIKIVSHHMREELEAMKVADTPEKRITCSHSLRRM